MLNLIGVELPGDFPGALFESIYQRVHPKLSSNEDAKSEFSVAFATVQYRFVECTEHDENFSQLIRAYPTCAGRERFWQEKALFGFFYSGRATLEALAYGLFAAGVGKWPAIFRKSILDHMEDFRMSHVINGYKSCLPGDPFAQDLEEVLRSTACEQLRLIRNELTHRTQGTRLVFVGGSQDGTVVWRLKSQSLPINVETTARIRSALATTLADALQLTEAMTARAF